MKSIGTILRFLGFGLIVLALFFVGLATWIGYRPYRIVRTWPAVDADVVESKVYTAISRGVRNQGRPITVYGAWAQLRYTANGREYLSQIDIGYRTSVAGEMDGWTRRLAPGTRHRIRYSPEDPNRINLTVGYDAVSFAPSVALSRWALVLGVLGLTMLLVKRRT